MLKVIREHWRPGLDIAVDVEATGLSHIKDQLFGIAVTICPGGYYHDYIDVRKHDKEKVVSLFNDLFSSCRYIVNHHMGFDYLMLRAWGINVPAEKCICSMIRGSLINEHLFNYSLDSLSEQYLGEKKDEEIYSWLAAHFGGKPTRKEQIGRIEKAPAEIVGRYAMKDTELAYKLYQYQTTEIKRQGLEKVDNLERSVFPALVDMQFRGVRIDVPAAEKAVVTMDKMYNQSFLKLKKLIGETNFNSGKQLTEYFAPEKEGKNWVVKKNGRKYPIQSTATGAPSWASETLKALPFAETKLIIEVKKYQKIRDTFLKGHILGHQINGRVYPNINQTIGEDGGTKTGRLSYNSPALQQIPNRDKEVASVVRPVFLPEEGHRWIYGDLDQHEYRVFAHYSKSKPLIQAYEKDPNTDVHKWTSGVLGVPRNVPPEGGANAKQLNFSIIFCMSPGRVAKILGQPYAVKERDGFTYLEAGQETLDLLDKYHKMVPGIKDLQDRIKAKARGRGYIETLGGRHIRFPRKDWVYKAPGLLFQGSSGDLNKENNQRIFDTIKGSGALLLMNIHDEYSLSVPEGKEGIMKDVQAAIEDRDLRVPIRIDFGKSAKNWWEATQK